MRKLRTQEKESQKFARHLRKNMTEAEHRLWHHIRHKHLDGYRFRRQHPIGKYIADFACISEKLVVEIDGGTHSEDHEVAHDQQRTIYLERKGWIVVRYGNEEIYKNLSGVLDDIYTHLKGLK